ncbi:MAG: NAD(+)/NADH kinase, partial [Bacteroidales bacterium]|nr:NAD(+)/NADH kinase [Bacteroidales bacterium]
MIVTYFVKHSPLESDPRTEALLSSLRQKGCEVVRVQGQDDALPEGASLLLSLGGDGTFLDATRIAASSGVPVMGVNLGRMGFLSGAAGDHIAEAIVSGSYKVEERSMIEVSLRDASGAAFVPEAKFWSCALNEVSVMRCGAAMIGIDVSVDGEPLPTYWADGLLVSTSTG